MALAELIVKLSMRGQSEVKSGLDQTKAGLKGVAAEGAAASAAVSSLGRTLVGIGAAVGAISLGGGALEAAAQYDSLQRGIATTVGSTKELNAQMADLRRIALLPGIDLKQTVQGFIQLRSAGLGVQDAMGAMRSVANAVASVGGSASAVEGVVRALSQMSSKAQVSQEEINQLTEHLPQAGLIVERAFGTRSTEAIQKMGVTGRDAARRILTEFGKLPKASAGIRTDMDNINDTMKQLQVSIGNIEAAMLKAFSPTIQRGIEKTTRFLSDIPANGTKIAQSIGMVVGALAAIGSARVLLSIAATVNALKILGQGSLLAGTQAAIGQALATRGMTVPAALAGAAAVTAFGVGANILTTQHMDGLLKGMKGVEGIPATGQGTAAGGGMAPLAALTGDAFPFVGKSGNVLMGVAAALGTLVQGRMDMDRQQTGWLGEIAHNTRRTFEALDLRAETLGGGALARVGVTGAERKSEVMSDAVARFAGATVTVGGSVLERQIRKVIGDELRRTGGRPVRRT